MSEQHTPRQNTDDSGSEPGQTGGDVPGNPTEDQDEVGPAGDGEGHFSFDEAVDGAEGSAGTPSGERDTDDPKMISSHTIHPDSYAFSYDEVRQILETFDHWIFAKNRDGEFIFANDDFAENCFGCSVEELRGTTDLDYIDDLSEGEEEAFRADDLQVMDMGEPLEVPQEPNRDEDGDVRVFRTIKKPFETDITDQDAMIGVAINITNQVDNEVLVDLHDVTQQLMYVPTRQEVAEVAIRAVTEVLGQEYCTVWTPTERGDRLELAHYSSAVERHADRPDLTRATAGPGDPQWEQFSAGESAVKTKVDDHLDPVSVPVDEPLRSHLLVPVGSYALLEVGSFDGALFKDDLPNIVASMMEAAFQRLEYERDVREISQEVDSTVTDVSRSTDEVASVSQSVTERADEQEATMETVLDGVTKLNASIEEIAATAETVDGTADEAVTLSDAGKASAADAQSVIDEATDSAAYVTEDVSGLQSKIDEIDEIVDVINEIADQTNILALNASIEAARQGQAGSGFAVVANEVKALAEETQTNATEIESLVTDVQDDAGETVESLGEMVEEIERGSTLVDEALAAFVDVADAIADVSHGVSEVANATDDQAASAEEISTQAEQAAEVASDVAAQASQIATANNEIADEVAHLHAVVGELTNTK